MTDKFLQFQELYVCVMIAKLLYDTSAHNIGIWQAIGSIIYLYSVIDFCVGGRGFDSHK